MHQAFARKVAVGAITQGIVMFTSLPVVTLLAPQPVLQTLVPFLPTVDSTTQVPKYSVGDHVEFELPGREFAIYAFGEVRSVTYAPLYAIVTPSGNYYTVAGEKVRARDSEEYLSRLDKGPPPVYQVNDIVKVMLPDRVRNVYVNARVTKVVEAVSYGVLSFHGNHFFVFEQDIRLMTDLDLAALCTDKPELAHTRMAIEERSFGGDQMEQLLSAQSSESLDAEERLRNQDMQDMPGLINGPECYQLPVPDFAETPFRFMGMEIDLRNAQRVSLSLPAVEALKCCTVCRTSPCKCRDDVEDECMVCNEVPCVCNLSALQLVTGTRHLNCCLANGRGYSYAVTRGRIACGSPLRLQRHDCTSARAVGRRHCSHIWAQLCRHPSSTHECGC